MLDKEKLLQEIFEDDSFGLLNVHPKISSARNADERLLASFTEINEFIEKQQREPEQGGGVQEHGLFSRLKGIRESPSKIEVLKEHDKFGLLNYQAKEINSLDDVLNDDTLGLLADDAETLSLFDLKHVSNNTERVSTDFVAKRKPCKNFADYEALFKEVQLDLASGKRKLLSFKEDNVVEGSFYVNNGVLFLLEKVNITQEESYLANGKRLRKDGRTRCVFENGTESNMLYRSVAKTLYANGKVVSENLDRVNENFEKNFQNITEDDQETGFIYILKSRSQKPEIKNIKNLYKIGFSKIPVEDRIKNAIKEPTYLMSDVHIVTTYQCFNLNPQKLELMLHTFFGKACLNLDIFDEKGQRHTPREWFVAPLFIIEQTVQLIRSGEIVNYIYDSNSLEIISK